MFRKLKNTKGFTLIEVLLVVAIIAILAGIVILAVNPGKQLGDTRNAQRKADVNTILNAIYQYSIDNQGNLPATIPAVATPPFASGLQATLTPGTNDICRTYDTDASSPPTNWCDVNPGNTANVAGGTQLVNLSVLTASGKYLVGIPSDPHCGSTTSGLDSGYQVSQDTNGRVTVWAPCTEQNIGEISATR